MSLLDEIEDRAREATEAQARAAAARRAESARDAKRTRSFLQQVEAYLQRTANALNAGGEPITVSYDVPELGRLDGLRQAGYLVVRDPEQEDAVRFHFECRGARNLKRALPSESQARALEKALVDAGLSCRRVAQRGVRRALLVEGRVPVSVAFQRAGADIEIRTRNLSAIETRRYTLAPERINWELLEAFLEVVLRRGDRLAALTGDEVPEVERERLRKRLARRERQREAELGGTLSRVVYPFTEALRRMLLRQ